MIGKYVKCNTNIKMVKCGSKSVRSILIEHDNGKEYELTIFNDILQQICERAKEEVKDDNKILMFLN